MTRADLDERVLGWIAEGVDSPRDDSRFDDLALALFRHQFEHNAPYRKMCHAFELTPDRVQHWQEIPSVPTGVFKEVRLAAFPAELTLRTFRTSGSTNELRGELHLDTLAVYDASLLATFGAYVCPDREPLQILALTPPARQARDSSLSYMFESAMRALGAEGSRFLLGHTRIDMGVVLHELRELRAPVALCGTAFAFVHLLDALSALGLDAPLPAGSRLMETGGFKGRSREIPRVELHSALQQAFSVAPERIINQYGMCELGSQFYEPSLVTGKATTAKRIPPWVRTRSVDPASFEEVPSGEPGLLIHYDLANTGSVLAVQTSDLGRVTDGALEVLGRVPDAEARGCSIAADLMLGEA